MVVVAFHGDGNGIEQWILYGSIQCQLGANGNAKSDQFGGFNPKRCGDHLAGDHRSTTSSTTDRQWLSRSRSG
jgi:hypothetical protein